MALIILPIVSLALYLSSLFSPTLVIVSPLAGFALAIVSYKKCAGKKTGEVGIGFKYFSLFLVILGVVFLVSIVLSVFLIGPIVASAI